MIKSVKTTYLSELQGKKKNQQHTHTQNDKTLTKDPTVNFLLPLVTHRAQY